jgi:hypothetical protein
MDTDAHEWESDLTEAVIGKAVHARQLDDDLFADHYYQLA